MNRTAVLDDVEYSPGRKFRVVRDGARLSGWEPKPGYQQGWGRPLEVGEVIECAGLGAGMGSDPGYGVHWSFPGKNCVAVKPEHGGPWGYRPQPGYLEPVDA